MMRAPEKRLADVFRAAATGARPKFVFFWKEPDLAPGCLSQWWPAPFVVDGVTYRTAEHWMMAGKARLFEDSVALEKVLHAPTPHAAKSLGRAVRGYAADRWAAARYDIVVAGNFALMEVRERL